MTPGPARKLPKYRWIMKVIQERIANGTYPPATMLPAERTLAAEFAANHETTNKAISNLVAEGLLHRRRGIGTFVATDQKPHPPAPGRPAIDLLLYKHAAELFGASTFHEEIMFRLQGRITARGYACHIVPVKDLPDFRDYLAAPGAVITSKFLPYRLLNEIVRLNKPAVCLNIELVRPQISAVLVGNGALDDLCRHLHELGHRQICFAKGTDFQYAHELRLARYKHLMQMMELEANIRRVLELDPEDESAPGRLLKDLKPSTAVVAADDYLAIKLKQMLNRLHLRVPEDVSLTGFGNLSITQTLYPALTTADVDREELCRILVEEAEALLARKSPGRLLTVTSRPIIRASTAHPS